MRNVANSLIVVFIALLAMMRTTAVGAQSYRKALEAYSEQDFARSYRKALAIAREETGIRRAKALMLAAAAALEMDKEDRARTLFQKALTEDSELDLPGAVKSRRAIRFFDRVRLDQGEVSSAPEPAFDQLQTYLPFGFNQFFQDKYVLGLLFGSVQAYAIYHAYGKLEAADNSDSQIREATRTAFQTGNDINPVFIKFKDESRSFSQSAREEAQLAILLGALAYSGSVLEAGWYPPAARHALSLMPESSTLFAMEMGDSRWRLDLVKSLSVYPALQLSLDF